MRPKLIIFDIDGTLFDHVSSWQYIHEHLKIWDEHAIEYQNKFQQGKISYKKFCELDAACWRGIKQEDMHALFERVPYIKGAKKYLKKLKKEGFKLAAVSTGLQYLARRIEVELDFDRVLCNKLLSYKGRLTGKVRIDITHGAKARVAKRLFKEFSASPAQAIGVGDSAGDIPLFNSCGYSIAFNSSSKKLSKLADYNCRTKDFKEVYNRIKSH